jgi:hypothetical protein
MATHDPEFYQAPKFSPEYDEPRSRQRGCFFYGCVIASVLIVLMIIALALVAYLAIRTANRYLEEYTATAPRELPKVDLSEEQRKEAVDRLKAFRQAVNEGTATEPLVLTGDDLNALLEEEPQLKGRVHLTVEGDEVKGQVSIPLSVFLDTSFTQGRYLNGEAKFKASLDNGVLIVTLDSLEVNGKSPPEQIMTDIRKQNLARDAYKDPKNAEMMRRFESLQIKDGKIILKPRAPAGPTPKPAVGTPAKTEPPHEPATPKALSPESAVGTPAKTEPPHEPATPKALSPESAPAKRGG